MVKCLRVYNGFCPTLVFRLRLHSMEKRALCVVDVSQELQTEFTVSANHKMADLSAGTDVLANNE